MLSNTETAKAWLRALQATAQIAAHPGRILPIVIHELVESQGDATAIIYKRQSWTYREFAGRINRYARWALAQRIGKGDVVALLMPNCPNYLAIWLGITRVGGIVALLNTNVGGAALAHCIEIAKPAHIIVDAGLLKHFEGAAHLLTAPTQIWSHGDGGSFPRIDQDITNHSDQPLAVAEAQTVTIRDRALLIYTSGTTGLPKAANVSHLRVMQWSLWFAGLLNTGPDDRMYDCLPMYHSVGGLVATGAFLVRGGSIVIRERFSVSEFWDDVVSWNCTHFQYIGELCRYLVNAPEHPLERQHGLRVCCGNGLRADVWERFQARFAVPQILEFYAATESNVSLFNVEGKVGAVGRIPSFLAHRFPLALVKFDAVTQKPQRDDDGLCIRCNRGEVGEALGRIRDGASRIGADFEGYTEAKESESKVVRDVFERGDAWYRTGDLMRTDKSGFFYFIDRVGDTFRWKGENVSASEVASTITSFSGIVDAAVYGVPVPGTEGSAGMAAIVVEGNFDLVEFRKHLAQALPAYARPLFLRVQKHIATTATFKHQKSNLVREGFEPDASDDPIYFDDPLRKAYRLLNRDVVERIRTGEIRL
jgi:fatty-acyl-CoA synthase